MLIEEAGVDPLEASLHIDPAKFEISVTTSKKNYDKIVKNIQNLLLNDVTFTVAKALQHNVSIIKD